MEDCDKRVLMALKSRSKSLCLDSNKLHKLSDSLGRLVFLTSLSVKNNHLKSLNCQLAKLTALNYLNAGSNDLKDECLEHLVPCTQLVKLHLFKNCLTSFTPKLCSNLVHLQVLNLNWNQISSLPGDIGHMQCLEQLSLSHNKLQSLPREIGSLKQLKELHLDNNVLSSVPTSLHKCSRLTKLLLHKNELKKLPESVGRCKQLAVLDVSCNQLELFPASLHGNVKIKEFYYDDNPLLPHIPIPSEQQLEVIQLKELAARALVRRLESTDGWLERLTAWDTHIGHMCSQAGRCALCGGPYLQSQLDCVQFIPVKKVLPSLSATTSSASGLLPISSPLCSYQCFNSQGHNFYGIATP